MGSSIFFGGSVVAAVLAGIISLLAPCCVSVMLPAYFAASFHNTRLRVVMTFVFAAGIATVILPLVLGASTIRRVILNDHATVYLVGGLVLVGLGVFTLAGGKLRLPSPAGRPSASGPFGVYSLGLFSGVASSCCAPVLAGVIALSGVSGSWAKAVGLGFAYVFGMVAPLMVMSVLWDRFDWQTSRLFRPRSFTWRIGNHRRTVTATAMVSGLMLLAMGVWALFASRSGGMRAVSSGWQANLLLDLQDLGHRATRSLSWMPTWVAWLLFAAIVAALGRTAIRQWQHSTTPPTAPPTGPQTTRRPVRPKRLVTNPTSESCCSDSHDSTTPDDLLQDTHP